MNDFKIGIKDRHPLIDFAYYGSKARRHAHPDVLIGEHSPYPLFREGDILDANAIFNLIKCTRWKEWQSVEKIDEHIANDVIHVTQEDKDKWNNYEQIQSDWNESDEESYAFIKNKPILSTVAISGSYADLLNKPFIPATLADLQDDSTHRVVTDDQISTWGSKQDAIDDLDVIRSGAAAGATALQPSALNDYYNKTSVDNKLLDKQDVISDLNTIRSGAQAGATAYQKPVNGIPSTDMTSGVQTSLGKADTAYQKPQDGIPSTDMSSAVQTSLGKADTALQEHQDISGKVDVSDIGVANGIAQLDANGKVPSAQLPSYVDDVLEYPSIFQFPQPGETGKIYVDTTFNKTYRWGGSTYVEISESLALGETSSTAYAGDKGKSVTDNFNTHAANTDIHVTAAKQASWDAKSNFSGSYNDLTDKPTIPAAQIQSDWNQSDNTQVDYIKNKPTIPVMPTDYVDLTSNQTITGAKIFKGVNRIVLQGNSASEKPGFAVNNSSGTKMGFLEYRGGDNLMVLGVDNSSSAGNNQLKVGLRDYGSYSYNATIPIGVNKNTTFGSGDVVIPIAVNGTKAGNDGNISISIPAAQVNSDWNAASGVAQILNKPTIPANVSDLNNDSGYVTAEIETGTTTPSDAGVKLFVDTSGDATVEVYSKAQVNSLIANKPDMWVGTQSQYDQISTKDPDTLYVIITSS